MGEMDVERRWETFEFRRTDRDLNLGVRVRRTWKRRGVIL